MLAAGMKPSMKPTETTPSANATGMPENSSTSVVPMKRMPSSCSPTLRSACFGVDHFLDDLHDVLERDQGQPDRDQRERDPEVRGPDRIGGPALAPGLRGVLPHLDAQEAAQQQRQHVAGEDAPAIPARRHQRLEHFGADVAAFHLRVVGGEEGRRHQQEDVELEVPGVRLVQEIAPDDLVGDGDAGHEDQYAAQVAGDDADGPDRAAKGPPGWMHAHSRNETRDAHCVRCPPKAPGAAHWAPKNENAPALDRRMSSSVLARRSHLTASAMSSSFWPSFTCAA